MSPHAVDTNILLRSIQSDHAMHLVAVQAVARLTELETPLCILPQNVRGFWNVCTRPRERNGLGKTPSEADIAVSQLKDTFTVLDEIPAIYEEWRILVVRHQVSGVQVHDANLAAAMNVYEMTHLLTFNGNDFARYPSLTIVDPASV